MSRPRSHGRHEYLQHGCRCDVCTTASRDYTAAWKLTPRGLAWSQRRKDPAMAKRHRIKHAYDLTPAQHAQVFEDSDGLCANCYEVPATQIDHDHETGATRGALCSNCNSGLGKLGDNEAGLLQALEYLRDDNS